VGRIGFQRKKSRIIDMQVSLTATGGLERRLEVAVPAQRVDSEIEQRLKKISRTARLKGFRPGKAPMPVIRQQFGEQVRAEVIGDLMRSTFAEAVNQEKLKPAAGPRIEPLAMPPEADLRYAAVFEIFPEVKIKPVDSIAIERPTSAVGDADVDAMIESMRAQRPNYTEVTRPAHDTDRVTVDYDGRINGESFEGGVGRDVQFLVGSGRVLPELDGAVKDASPGETRTVSLKYPDNHQSKALAGQTAEFTLTLKKVEEQTLPPVDDVFARAYGVEEGGLEALRAEVRKSMEREMADLIRNRVRTQVMDALYRDNAIEVPKALVDEQIQQMQLDMARRMGAKDASQLPPREPFEEPARRRVALGLIIAEIIRTEGIKVDRDRVLAQLNELAASYSNPEEMRRAYLQNADAMRQIESAVLEEQAVDWVVGRAKVTERPMSFKELTGFGQVNESQT
jgi:trigger factor